MLQSGGVRCPTPSLRGAEPVAPVTVPMARLGPYYALRRAPQSFRIIKASESLASLKSEQPGGELAEARLWHPGGTAWVSATWRSSRRSASPVPRPSGRAALLRVSGGRIFLGGSSKPLPNVSPFSCAGWPRANRLNPSAQPDAPSEPVSCPFPSSGPEEADPRAEGMVEAAAGPHKRSAPRAAGGEEGPTVAWLKPDLAPRKGWATLQVNLH